MGRGLLIGGLAVVSLCIVCCALAFVVGLPRLRDGFEEGVQDAMSTEVAKQIPIAEAGTYTITEASLQESLRQSGGSNSDDLVVDITTAGVEVGISAQGGQDATYTGVPAAVDGRFVMQDMDTSSEVLGFFLSPGALGGAIENAVNNYLSTNRLSLESVTLADGEMTLQVVDAS